MGGRNTSDLSLAKRKSHSQLHKEIASTYRNPFQSLQIQQVTTKAVYVHLLVSTVGSFFKKAIEVEIPNNEDKCDRKPSSFASCFFFFLLLRSLFYGAHRRAPKTIR